MQIYEYKCKNCEKINEFFLSDFNEGDLKCNFCGGKELVRLFSKTSVLKNTRSKGKTCCGRDERCDTPPCSGDSRCRR